MLLDILTHTPSWVFVLFAALLWLGLKQLLTHELSLARASALALGMSGWSLYGTASAFGGAALPIMVWLVSAAAVLAVLLRRKLPPGVRYDAARARFTLPGSAAPLVLMMGIFFTKYSVGVALSVAPGLSHDTAFAVGVAALYGAFSAVFGARALRLWRLALAEDRRQAMPA